MREKFIILSALLLSPLCAYGVCPTDTPESDCWTIPGCQYDVPTKCHECDANYYCDGLHTSAISCSSATNGLFPNSDEGSDDITDCYTDGYAADGTTPGCEDEETGIDSSCKVHCLAQESDYTYINTYADAYDYGLSAKCGDGLSWNDYYHIELNNNELFCLGKKLACSQFNGSCEGGTVTGTATYGTEWNISSCVCEKVFSNTSDRHCDGNNVFNSATNVTQNFFDSINFSSNSSYYCNKCEAGYYVKQTGGGCSTPPEDATKVVCKCGEKIPKGSYAVPLECTWNASTLSYMPCQPHPCPNPGQTTLNDGAMNEDLCQYAPNDISGQTPTKFCDAKGCFTLSSTDIDDWYFNH